MGFQGGFVLKAAPPSSDRDAFHREGVACYQTFLRGLLDLTDNLIQGKGGAAARKSCATIRMIRTSWSRADKAPPPSPITPTAISKGIRSLAGDAPSPPAVPSVTTTKMGITAKGAGTGQAPFPYSGVTKQTTDFTVAAWVTCRATCSAAACCSRSTSVWSAAFDHRHIFLDPEGGCGEEFCRTPTLFALPRSSWDDYDKSLISKAVACIRAAPNRSPSPKRKAVLGIIDA